MVFPANAALVAFLSVIVVVASYDMESWDRPNPTLYDSSLSPDEDFLLNYLRSRSSGSDLVRKRSRGMLDFGMTRGASGAKAAKARLGLKLANDPYGPGR
ncbi:uncharacterized protein LOC135394182 [Ornithodoros turicata]|uniref:uncharacterized protein LOC135394182 n=1 Tax=Ornithodoros turicata TaxID=34597 RepID=UPI003138B4C6